MFTKLTSQKRVCAQLVGNQADDNNNKVNMAAAGDQSLWSNYVHKLPLAAKDRYKEKLQYKGKILPDPYTLTDWENNPLQLPNVTFPDIYFI